MPKRTAQQSARLSRIAKAPRQRVEAQRTGRTVRVVRGGTADSWLNAWNRGLISINDVPSEFLAEVCQ